MPQQLADHLDRYVLFLQGRGERVTDRVRGDRLTHTTNLRQRPQGTVKAQQGAVVFRIGRLTRFLPAQKREQVRRVLVRASRQLIQQEPYIGRDFHPDERPALLTVVRQDPVLDILFPQMGEIHERHPAEREHQAKTQLGSPHLRLNSRSPHQRTQAIQRQRLLPLALHACKHPLEQIRDIRNLASLHRQVIDMPDSPHIGGHRIAHTAPLRQPCLIKQEPLFVYIGIRDFLHPAKTLERA